ncbi:hypothetical protein B0T10DRAFT_31279 [Thelonectria olida]|uniref:Uncharacterized protein n=1 Tax=Thelonectria olida TaxID=1576542 RepID=A0A9P9AWJ9_9HYPO|nr:hypothetical protein B0T10DRAFT_31279 [Thelonectria olida]
MKFLFINLVLSSISFAWAASTAPYSHKELPAIKQEPPVAKQEPSRDTDRLFPHPVRLTKPEVKIFNKILAVIVNIQGSMIEINPSLKHLFVESMDSWNNLRTYTDRMGSVEERDFLFPLESLRTALANVIIERPTLKNKKAVQDLLMEYVAYVGFLCYSYRGKGDVIPPTILESPAELFGIMLRFLAYDVQELETKITMPTNHAKRPTIFPKKPDVIPHPWRKFGSNIGNPRTRYGDTRVTE